MKRTTTEPATDRASVAEVQNLTEVDAQDASCRAFGGVAEISAVYPDEYIIAPAAGLSPGGCFVRTSSSLPVGTKVNVRITHSGSEFEAPGEIAYILYEEGVGVMFDAPLPQDREVLEVWLKQTMH